VLATSSLVFDGEVSNTENHTGTEAVENEPHVFKVLRLHHIHPAALVKQIVVPE
jgi:hypothetical protein